MGLSRNRRVWGGTALAGLIILIWGVSRVEAQLRLFSPAPCCPAPCGPGSCPPAPCPSIDPKVMDPKVTDPILQPPPITTAALGDGVSIPSNVGYIYNALPLTMAMLRVDSAYGNNRPDRAEFFYAKCGCFPPPSNPGPPLPETNVDYQDITAYIEYAPLSWFSAYIEAPARFINPANNVNTVGVGDIKAGGKIALLSDADQIITLHLRTYIPTGASNRGLGTDHVSLEPSLLYLRRLTNRLTFESQFGDWIPIGGTEFASNVLLYGAGLGYTTFDNGTFRVTPVVEFVGWTVLGGQQFLFPENVTQSAAGDTIVNGKFGVRAGFNQADLYIGYGRALTGDVWYKDIVRAELRVRF